MKNRNLIALIVMFALTIISARLSFVPGYLILLPVAFWLKSFLVASYFMELRNAHPVWRIVLMVFLAAVLGVVWIVGK